MSARALQRLRWGHPPAGLYNVPLEAAIAAGDTGRAGLAVETHSHPTGEEYAAAIRAGRYDMGHIGTPVFLPAMAGGGEYVVVSLGLCDYPPFYLVAAPGVRRLAACAGEPVAINRRRTCPGSLLAWQLAREGLAPEAIEVLELMAASGHGDYGPAFVEAAAAGRFRAGVLYEPWVSLVERVLGWSVIADFPALVRPSSYAFLVYARRSLVRDRPALVERMLATYFRAVRDALAEPEVRLAAFAGTIAPAVTPEDVLAAVRREAARWRLEPGLPDQALLAEVRALLVTQRLVPPAFDPQTLLAA